MPLLAHVSRLEAFRMRRHPAVHMRRCEYNMTFAKCWLRVARRVTALAGTGSDARRRAAHRDGRGCRIYWLSPAVETLLVQCDGTRTVRT